MSRQEEIQTDERRQTGAERLDSMIKKHPLPTWRPVAWTVMILVTGSLIWAFTARLDEVTVAEGVVVPLGDLKVIQHLEGGIIQKINVREGDEVKAGMPLMQLDVASSGSDKSRLQADRDKNLLMKVRLEAEANGDETLQLPREVLEREPELASAERQTFNARRAELQRTLAVMNEPIQQRELEVRGLIAKRKSIQRKLALARERLKDSEKLLADKLVPRSEHQILQAEVEDIESEIQTLDTTIPSTQSAADEAKQRRREVSDRFRREAREQLGEVEGALARLREELRVSSEKGDRLEIKSPIDGIVKNMRYNTIGGVIKPGEPIMEIVPTGDKLVIDAKLNPVDRGFVVPGQAARVKVSTYDFVRYGALEGKVTLVAPDVTEEGEDEPYFQVQIQTDKTYLGQREGDLPITPGMQATVDIKTGTKTVIDFLIKPVLKMKAEAFRER